VWVRTAQSSLSISTRTASDIPVLLVRLGLWWECCDPPMGSISLGFISASAEQNSATSNKWFWCWFSLLLLLLLSVVVVSVWLLWLLVDDGGCSEDCIEVSSLMAR